ncbi:MAG: acetamidase/formamidase family protein [Candidatus Bathyarchaeia archaeon]
MKHTFIPSKYYLTYGPHEPALRVRAGDTIVTTTVDAGGYDSLGKTVPEEKMQRREDTEYYRANPLAGPFYIEGADVGDTLAVHIERITLNRGTAWSSILPHFGSFTEEGPGRRLLLNEPLERIDFHWTLDLGRNVGILNLPRSRLKRMEVPLQPFIGSIGVAPRYGRHELSLTPGEYGGNMDCVETREGATLYLPVFVRGAYLGLGDIHAAQGDGEVCGVALETTAEVALHLEVVKGKEIHWPRLEDDEFIMVAGSGRPLMEAFKIAHLDLLRWLVTDYGFDLWEGFQALSQVGTCRVGNVVDPNYTVVAKFPKRYLP